MRPKHGSCTLAPVASQAHKFVADPVMMEKVRQAKGPIEAKRLGRAGRLRPDWESVKYRVMLRAVTAKFEQHEDMRVRLLATAPCRIVERCGDREWGDGGDGTGRNLFGKCLVEVRDSLMGQSNADGCCDTGGGGK